jgi:pyruvate/2-oxoglutarate dehydrogenase complex dihydrolipoamide dehydrogenase (E3) component
MTQHYDAIVIGTGQAGPSLAVRLGQAGQSVAIIERDLVGGTCVNNGCIPTKTLIASARAAHVARHGADFGVVIEGTVRVDMPLVKARKDAIVRQSNQGVTNWLRKAPNVALIEGQARFEGPRTVRVGETLLEAERIFINVGGRAIVPAMPGLAEVPYLTNASMMAVDFLPEHLIVVGGSYVGLEFAQMYRRFGSRVTVVEMGPRIIAREDDDVSAAVQAILEGEGIAFQLSATCLDVRKAADGVNARVSCNKGVPEIEGTHVLLAVGRMPNTDDLGLDKAGVRVDARGYIEVDDTLATNVPGVWALGDVNGKGAFTHTSYNDFEIVAANLLDADTRRVSDRISAYALFIDPPLARIGMNEREARESGRKVLAGRMLMARVGRARERSETQGFMQVLVDAETKRILGATLLGIEADEAIHCLLDVMYARLPYTVIQRAVHIHPTVSELLPTVLGDLKPLG